MAQTPPSAAPDADQPATGPTPVGLYDRPAGQGRITGVEMAALVLSALWLLGSAIFFLRLDAGAAGGLDALRFMLTILVIFLPVAMIWVAATAARSSIIMREESARLQAAVDAMRRAYVAQSQAAAQQTEPQIARKLDEIAQAQKKTETTLAMFTSTRADGPTLAPIPEPLPPAAPPATSVHDDQRSLPLGTSASEIAAPLAAADFIRALNFPENAEDKAGFAALRRALKDRSASQLIQAAQDVLTLLSQDGIYMDDLRPDRARPDVWRRFAAGERGRTVAALGGVRDRASLALTAGRMRQDTIFRDAVHHFLRLFDRGFAAFETTATDAEIAALTDTRTARAFMLLGRVAGTFD